MNVVENIGVFIRENVWLENSLSPEFRLFSSQTFSRINTPTFSTTVILHTFPPMKMKQTECVRNVGIQNSDAGELPRRQHITRIKALLLCDKITVFTYVWRPNKLGKFKVLKAALLMIKVMWECKILSPIKWFLKIRTASPEDLKPRNGNFYLLVCCN